MATSLAQIPAVAAPLSQGSFSRNATSGLKASSLSPACRSWSLKTVSNGSRVNCMKVWNPIGNPRFETLSYLPPLSDTAIAKEIEYMISKGWIPCLEFDASGVVYREYNSGPGYYDGRYWTMWKLPLFGCTDSTQVLKELAECKAAYPQAFIRILGFDNVRQVQCVSFIAYKPT
eukprot:TRINITY_DN731_c0_g2_i6.p1 TRINITY_DN731_c0_g2~~TRINITY_DN731_c0_g2_i6.p1  ORF type:complete len:174 (+),score=20.87 TRINITY_DN731_c0_g2_i6:165-686(+)